MKPEDRAKFIAETLSGMLLGASERLQEAFSVAPDRISTEALEPGVTGLLVDGETVFKVGTDGNYMGLDLAVWAEWVVDPETIE